MRITVLSHACMEINSGGKVLLTDPWLIGSCYWRSWWNYPPVDEAAVAALRPDAIYLTHIHWDHFHGPTLKKFDRDTEIVLPLERNRRVRRDLEDMGFKNIVEVPHGKSHYLAPDFKLTSYQFSYWGDSALVVEAEGVSLLNANDAKFMGAPLDQIIKSHGRFDFAFRSHSSANDRICWRYWEDGEATHREDPVMYARSFYNFMEKVTPRYAVPFASNHCHLHREVYGLNSYVQTPDNVQRYVESRGGFSNTELSIMLAGDSWDSETGFHRSGVDYFGNRAERIEAYRDANAAKLEATYKREDRVRVRLEDIQRFFDKFLAAVPRFARKSFKDKPIIFRANAGEHRDHFRVDVHTGRIEQLEEDQVPADPIMFETTALILRHAMAVNMFSHIGISKRVVYRATHADARYLDRLNTLLAAYEYEVLPLRLLFSLRTARVYLRRWRELVVYAQVLLALRRGRPMPEIEARLLGAEPEASPG